MSEEKDEVVVDIESLVGQSVNATGLIPTIDRVHKGVNAECYEPEILSIGPIHRGKYNFKGMEQHKVMYLRELLRRRSDLTVEEYVIKLRSLEENARQFYEPPVSLDRDEFVKLLLLDGCFIIELVRKYWFNDLRDKNDPIFRYEHVLYQLRHDLMLFENQLPLFVLDHLFNMTKSGDPEDNMRSLVLFFIDDLVSCRRKGVLRPDRSNSGKSDEAHHLLGLVYESYFPLSAYYSRESDRNHKGKDTMNINTASELKQAGIKFKISNKNTLLDLSFSDGVMYVPSLRVSDRTESFLRNLIAYEQQFSSDRHKHVMEYAFFMHCLINSKRDIKILRRSGFISNWLGDDRAVYLMFNRLGENVVRFPDSYYSDVFERVNQFSRARRNKWMAKLKRRHCNSPWTLISFVAGAILLLLTATQTVFSILSFFTQKHR